MGQVKLQKPCTYMKCKIAIAHLEELYQSDKFLQSPALGRRKTSFMANRHFSQKDRKCITLIQKTPVKYLIGNNHFCSPLSSSFSSLCQIPQTCLGWAILFGANPILYMIFVFMQMYYIFMHSRINIHKNKVRKLFFAMQVLINLPPSYQHV